MKTDKKIRVAIQGDRGSNHHLVVDRFIKDGNYELVCEKNFKNLCEAISHGNADIGVMAIENTIAGSILQNFDLLSNYSFTVIGELYLRISHNLIGIKGAKLEDIKAAYSHEMALKQSIKFLEENEIEPREYFDTAASVKHVIDEDKKEYAAIAPALAAEEYGGEIISKDIETNSENYTRFIVISKPELAKKYSEIITSKGKLNKTMIEFTLKNNPGSLVKALQEMADLDFNLSKIESRPIIGESWHYRFYVDFVSSKKDDEIRKNLNNLSPFTEYLRIMGIFPSSL